MINQLIVWSDIWFALAHTDPRSKLTGKEAAFNHFLAHFNLYMQLDEITKIWCDPQDDTVFGIMDSALYTKLGIGRYRWHINQSMDSSTVYIRGWYGGSKRYLHNVILPPPPGMQIDHINGDTFDNRMCNLRVVTAKENCVSRSARAKSGA